MLRALGGNPGIDAADVPLCRGRDSPCLTVDIWSRSDLPHGLTHATPQNARDFPPLLLIVLCTTTGHPGVALPLIVAASCSQLALLLWEAERMLIPRHGAPIRGGRGSRGPPRCIYHPTGDDGVVS